MGGKKNQPTREEEPNHGARRRAPHLTKQAGRTKPQRAAAAHALDKELLAARDVAQRVQREHVPKHARHRASEALRRGVRLTIDRPVSASRSKREAIRMRRIVSPNRRFKIIARVSESHRCVAVRESHA